MPAGSAVVCQGVSQGVCGPGPRQLRGDQGPHPQPSTAAPGQAPAQARVTGARSASSSRGWREEGRAGESRQEEGPEEEAQGWGQGGCLQAGATYVPQLTQGICPCTRALAHAWPLAHTRLPAHTHVPVCNAHIQACMYMHVHKYTYMPQCTPISSSVYMPVHMHPYKHTYIHAFISISTHTHTHSHISLHPRAWIDTSLHQHTLPATRHRPAHVPTVTPHAWAQHWHVHMAPCA